MLTGSGRAVEQQVRQLEEETEEGRREWNVSQAEIARTAIAIGALASCAACALTFPDCNVLRKVCTTSS